jgi:hypothetical protein
MTDHKESKDVEAGKNLVVTLVHEIAREFNVHIESIEWVRDVGGFTRGYQHLVIQTSEGQLTEQILVQELEDYMTEAMQLRHRLRLLLAKHRS